MTESTEPLDNRWYDDACGTALALELIGERWSLLIVRELMFGGRRFSELRSGLPRISANILTQRLARLERVGIIRRRKLPPPASVQVYELTAWGYEAEVILQELGRWATRSPLHDPSLPLSAASILMSFRTMYSRERARGAAGRIGFRFGEDRFVVEFGADGLRVRRDEIEGCAAVVQTTPEALAAVVYGGQPLSAALRLSGDRDLFQLFVACFPVPPKLVQADEL